MQKKSPDNSSASCAGRAAARWRWQPIAASLALAGSGICLAALTGVAAAAGEHELSELTVRAEAAAVPAVPANLPASVESVTAKQIAESVNTVTSAETIQYLPSIHVRQRYIGDRNSILVMRANSSIASAQTIVYADNLLLSNFLNNSFSTPPRWGMVSPEEIARVDVIYGPFSALYPGNSMGGVVQMATRMPERFEAHVSVDAFGQQFRHYGTDRKFTGQHASAAIGHRVGDWSLWLSGDHLDNEGHPQTFGNAVRAAPQPAPATAFTAVSGEIRDIDTSGNPRIITSAIGADHSVQDMAKLKLGYDIAPGVRATYTLGYWQNETDTSVESYLRDGAGNPVYNTPATVGDPGRFVKFAGDPAFYTLAGVSPGYSASEHWMHGLAVKTTTGGEWDWEAVASRYDQDREIARTATNTGSLFDSGTGAVRPRGTLTVGDGTGWATLDLRGEWRPGGDRKSTHQWSFGYHYDEYELVSDTYNVTADWLAGAAGARTSASRGKTETQALYLQDAIRLAPELTLVAGGRLERWRAFDGSNFNSANPAPTPLNVVYGERSESAFSPKLALSWQASPDWALRGSFGQAYRFPSVAEMFQLINFGAGTQRTNDPNLKPEQVRSGELTAELGLANGIWRTSLFWEDKRDGLVSQTDTTVTPNISSVQNVDKIFTHGVETALQVRDLLIRGFDLSGSITYVDSEIRRNARNPAVVGRDQPRIPNWRATLVGVYRPTDRLSLSLAARYSGQQHNSLAYNDINPNVYGAVSSFTVIDTKAVYKLAKNWSAAVGVNNLGNYTYFVNPNPYPQRTYFANLKFDY
ncbi:MAG: TonB-dependent receptor [Burkholderiaceae bacterium]